MTAIQPTVMKNVPTLASRRASLVRSMGSPLVSIGAHTNSARYSASDIILTG